jgi:hypothetical protein
MKTKLQTTIPCPKCGTKIDFSHVKEAVKQRLDEEFDEILERL